MSSEPATRVKLLCDVVDVRAGNRRPTLLAVSIHHGVIPREYLTHDEPRADNLDSYKLCEPGDLVLNRMRAFQGAIGVADRSGIVSPDYLVLRPRRGTEARFLHYLFRSSWFVGEMVARLRGIGSVDTGSVRTPRINADDLFDIRVHVPPRAEQQAVADYLDRETARIDALIAAKHRARSLLDERFAAIRDATIVLLDGPSIKLGRFVQSIGQGFSPQAEDRQAEPGEWGVLKLSAVKSGVFVPSEHKALSPETKPIPSLVPRAGDLLVTRANTPQLVGDVCAVNRAPERLMLCDLIYVLRLSPDLDTRFAAEALLAGPARLQLSSAARGTSQSMVKLRGEDVKGVEIVVPPLPRQHDVVAMLDSVRRQHALLDESLRRSVELLHERRRALITAAVMGNLPIQVAA